AKGWRLLRGGGLAVTPREARCRVPERPRALAADSRLPAAPPTGPLLGVLVGHRHGPVRIRLDAGIKAGADHHAHHLTDEVAGLAVFAHVQVDLHVHVRVAVLRHALGDAAGQAQAAG